MFSVLGRAASLTDLDGPAIEPPAGTLPNFNRTDREHAVGYFVIIFCSILAVLAVSLRLASRYSLRSVHIEDLFLLLGLGVFAAYMYPLYSLSIWPGVHVHEWDIKLRDLERCLWFIHLGSLTYGISIMFVKLAILLDWLRMFVPLGQRNKLYWFFQGLIWSNVVFYVSGTFLEIFRCWPRQKIWDPLYVGGSCPIDIAANNFASTLVNLASDIAILLLPQWIIWNLHMTRAKRIGISLLFVIGIFATAAGLARLVYLLQLLNSDDEYFWIASVGLWGAGEIAAGFLIIGVPGVPKVAQAIQTSDSFTNLLSRLGLSNAQTEPGPNSLQPSLRTFGRRNPRRELWDTGDTETFGLVSLPAPSSTFTVQETENPPNAILKVTHWDVERTYDSAR